MTAQTMITVTEPLQPGQLPATVTSLQPLVLALACGGRNIQVVYSKMDP